MNQQTTKGYVYLLISKDKKSFKIGKSNEVNIRLEQLNKHWQFNLEESIILEVNKNNTINIERLLHRFLKDFRLKTNDKKDGYTEFFNIKALEYVDNYIQALSVLHDIKQMNYNEYCKKEKIVKNINSLNILSFKNNSFRTHINLLSICLKKYFKTKENIIHIDSKDFDKRFNLKDINIHLFKDFIKDPFNINNEKFAEIEYTQSKILFKINEKYIQLLNSNEALSLINYNYLIKLNSVHAQKLYFYLTQLNRFNFNKNIGKRIVLKMIDFKKILDLTEDSYPALNDFKKRALNICVEKINEKTDLNIDLKLDSTNEKGKKKDTIIIEFKQKEDINKKEKEEKTIKNIKQLEDNFSKQIEKQKPINNQNYKPSKFNYTTQPLINTSF